MTNPDTTQQQPTTPQPSQPDTGAQATSGGNTPSGDPLRNPDGTFAAPEPYRYPADYHVDYLRGKTPDEAASMVQGFVDSTMMGTAPPQPANPYPTQPVQPTYPPAPQHSYPPATTTPAGVEPTLPTAEEMQLYPDVAAQKIAAYNQHQMNQQMQPQLQQFWASQGQTNLGIARTQYGDEFSKWGPEIIQNLQNLTQNNPQLWTPENIGHVVNLVKGNHAGEIQAELVDAEVQRRIEGGTLRPSGDLTGTSITATETIDLSSDELPAEYRQQLQRVGISADARGMAELDTFLRKFHGNDVDIEWARKDWLDSAKKGKVVIEGASGFRREIPMEKKNG